MRIIFLLRYILIFLLMMPYQTCAALDFRVTFSLELQDYDIINLNSTLTLQNKDYAAMSDNQKALCQAGIKIAYKNRSRLCDLFVNFPLYHHVQEYNKKKSDKKEEQNIKVVQSQEEEIIVLNDEQQGLLTLSQQSIERVQEETLITALNLGINYSLTSSELSIKILPTYSANKSAYIKNMLLYNFVVRHYKRDAKGSWSFADYETKDGYNSFEDYLQKSRNNMYNAHQINDTNLDELDDKIKEAIALVLVSYGNKELKDFWPNLFGFIVKGLNRGINQ